MYLHDGVYVMPTFLVDVSSAACDSVVQYDTITGGTRHVNKKPRHNLNTHMHAGTTPVIRIVATSKQGILYSLKMVQ